MILGGDGRTLSLVILLMYWTVLLDVLCRVFTFHVVNMCIGSVVGLFSCVVWSLVNMFGGWLDSFSLVASLHGVYL